MSFIQTLLLLQFAIATNLRRSVSAIIVPVFKLGYVSTLISIHIGFICTSTISFLKKKALSPSSFV